MKYEVSIAVDGRIKVVVEAENFEEAKRKACEEVCDIDFGELEHINWDAENAEVFVEY